jgi:hypothetical protein
MHPVVQSGKNSPVYLNPNFSTDQKEKYGKKMWEDACIKARTEYNFGTSAVRW